MSVARSRLNQSRSEKAASVASKSGILLPKARLTKQNLRSLGGSSRASSAGARSATSKASSRSAASRSSKRLKLVTIRKTDGGILKAHAGYEKPLIKTLEGVVGHDFSRYVASRYKVGIAPVPCGVPYGTIVQSSLNTLCAEYSCTHTPSSEDWVMLMWINAYHELTAGSGATARLNRYFGPFSILNNWLLNANGDVFADSMFANAGSNATAYNAATPYLTNTIIFTDPATTTTPFSAQPAYQVPAMSINLKITIPQGQTLRISGCCPGDNNSYWGTKAKLISVDQAEFVKAACPSGLMYRVPAVTTGVGDITTFQVNQVLSSTNSGAYSQVLAAPYNWAGSTVQYRDTAISDYSLFTQLVNGLTTIGAKNLNTTEYRVTVPGTSFAYGIGSYNPNDPYPCTFALGAAAPNLQVSGRDNFYSGNMPCNNPFSCLLNGAPLVYIVVPDGSACTVKMEAKVVASQLQEGGLAGYGLTRIDHSPVARPPDCTLFRATIEQIETDERMPTYIGWDDDFKYLDNAVDGWPTTGSMSIAINTAPTPVQAITVPTPSLLQKIESEVHPSVQGSASVMVGRDEWTAGQAVAKAQSYLNSALKYAGKAGFTMLKGGAAAAPMVGAVKNVADIITGKSSLTKSGSALASIGKAIWDVLGDVL